MGQVNASCLLRHLAVQASRSCKVEAWGWRRDSEVAAKIPCICSLWQVVEVLKGLGLDSKRTWAKTWGSLSMEKLTLGLEIKFQANVAMWLLFYKNAKENVSEAARPGSSVSCPGSAEVHRQESAGLLTPKCLVCSTDSIHPPLVSLLPTPTTAWVHFVPWTPFYSWWSPWLLLKIKFLDTTNKIHRKECMLSKYC